MVKSTKRYLAYLNILREAGTGPPIRVSVYNARSESAGGPELRCLRLKYQGGIVRNIHSESFYTTEVLYICVTSIKFKLW